MLQLIYFKIPQFLKHRIKLGIYTKYVIRKKKWNEANSKYVWKIEQKIKLTRHEDIQP